MFIQTRASSVIILLPSTPASFVTLMWVETLSSVLLASSGCTSTAPPSLKLTFVPSVQLAQHWVGVARCAAPKSHWLLYSDQFPCYHTCVPSSLSPGFLPLPPGFYQLRPPHSPPRYPCSMCSHEIGKNSLKCSTCSKWVHFSSSFLTRANFRKICALKTLEFFNGMPVVFPAHVVLN